MSFFYHMPKNSITFDDLEAWKIRFGTEANLYANKEIVSRTSTDPNSVDPRYAMCAEK